MFNGIGSGIDNIKLSSVAVTLPCEVWKLLELRASQGTWADGSLNPYCKQPEQFIKMGLIAKGVDPLEGENGYAPTTWIALNVLTNHNDFYSNRNGNDQNRGWYSSGLRTYLNGQFYTDSIPKELQPYFRKLIKTSYSYVNSAFVSDYPTIDWIFVPSATESYAWAETDYYETIGAFKYNSRWTNEASRATSKFDESASSWWTRSLYYVQNYNGYAVAQSGVNSSTQNYASAPNQTNGVLIGFSL